MWRTIAWFVVKLVVVSAALFGLWEWTLAESYVILFRHVAGAVCGILGIELASLADSIGLVIPRFYNVLPFLSLIIATWGLTIRRRLIAIVAGVCLLVLWHVGLALAVDSIVAAHGLDRTAYQKLSPWFLISDALPIVLWVAFAYPSVAALFDQRHKHDNQ
ncbi:MAG: hypothetical protein GF341_10625 [candidate division Zixibacteria bacterium]|nr:hypothetical protein [candidate division Zixibacteria bacterium]